MSSPHSAVSKMRRTMGFALMVAFLSLGAISGCGSSNDDNDLFGSVGSDAILAGLTGVWALSIPMRAFTLTFKSFNRS